MSLPNVNNRPSDPDGQLLDEDSEVIYCQNDPCETPAVADVYVSETRTQDSTRCLCYTCYNAYATGVQHGRFFQAAMSGRQPDFRWGDQDPPGARESRIGSCAKLKSGGPTMTIVSDPDPNRRVLCNWFDGGRNRVSKFHLDALVVAD